jgi:hypothetical protein
MLWSRRYFAVHAMEVETTWNINDLKAARDEISVWRVLVALRYAGPASLAAARAPQVFEPLVSHGDTVLKTPRVYDL